MAVTVETLDKLERKITLSVPLAAIEAEVDRRLKNIAKKVKVDGFRPGKVPMNVVAQRYGYSTQYEVINDKVGHAFYEAALDSGLRVAGQPTIKEKEGTPPEGQLEFDAIFEVYPDIAMGDLSQVEVETLSADVNDEAIDRTIDILRKQRQTFAQRSADSQVAAGDRVTVDFVGKIDGEAFAGGSAEEFTFMVGEGQMLKEFDDAVRGMKVGESKTFPLNFPADYHGQDVAGKQADFMVTVRKLEEAKQPEVNDAFAKSLGIADGTVAGLRADVRKNLEREVKYRLLARNKSAVLDKLADNATLDLPKSVVQAELQRMMEGARADLKARGIPDADKAPLPEDIFRPQAERRVRLGLVVAELVQKHDLRATPEQVDKHLQDLAASYERPEDVMRWYKGNQEQMAQIEATVVENNVMDYALKQMKATDKKVTFEELMAQR